MQLMPPNHYFNTPIMINDETGWQWRPVSLVRWAIGLIALITLR